MCVGFWVGVWIRIEWALPWGGWNLVRGIAGVFSLKMSLQNVYDLWRRCEDVIIGWISNGFKLGLVFCVGL